MRRFLVLLASTTMLVARGHDHRQPDPPGLPADHTFGHHDRARRRTRRTSRDGHADQLHVGHGGTRIGNAPAVVSRGVSAFGSVAPSDALGTVSVVAAAIRVGGSRASPGEGRPGHGAVDCPLPSSTSSSEPLSIRTLPRVSKPVDSSRRTATSDSCVAGMDSPARAARGMTQRCMRCGSSEPVSVSACT